MKYYIIAGEASGDLHASNLVKSLTKLDPNTELYGWGGELMAGAGVKLEKHIKDLAFMGFAEVVMNLKTILGNINFCKKDILTKKPDVLILIDYPGFNLRIAKWAKEQKIPVCYYISPQIWAWHESRVHQIKKNVDLMLVILPFEQAFYRKYDYHVTFVGHPLLDVVPKIQVPVLTSDGKGPLIALLPGSRKQEICRILPIMLKVTTRFPDYRFAIACAPAIPEGFYDAFLKDYPRVERFTGKTYDLLSQAYSALVTSGTATLETALFNVPQVVCYKGEQLSYMIATKLITIKYISLVNLVMEKEVVKELIQHHMTAENLSAELMKINQSDERFRILNDYAELRKKLGDSGASGRAAEAIFQFIHDGHERV